MNVNGLIKFEYYNEVKCIRIRSLLVFTISFLAFFRSFEAFETGGRISRPRLWGRSTPFRQRVNSMMHNLFT